jgi:hypothetical protein
MTEVKDLVAGHAQEHYPDHELKEVPFAFESDQEPHKDDADYSTMSAAKIRQQFKAEYEALSDEEKAEVDEALEEHEKSRKRLVTRNSIKANHERRLRDAAAARGATA